MVKFYLRYSIMFFLFFGAGSAAFSEKAVFNLGGKTGGNNLLSSKNTKIQSAKFGYGAMGLVSAPAKFSEMTDMYLSFDFSEPVEETGSYTLLSYTTIRSSAKAAKFGEGAALYSTQSKEDGVKLRPGKDSFFAGSSPVHSFTIEFWLKPQIIESGSVILKWWSSLSNKKDTMFQNIIAAVSGSKIEWSFLNIWQDKDNKGLDIKLSGYSNLVPEIWSHHLVTYNEDTGLLEYRVNGKVEAVTYLTDTRKENRQVLFSMLGTEADVTIGSKYSGLIDEFRITKLFSEQGMPWQISALFEKFAPEGGRIETNLIDTNGNKSAVKMLRAVLDKPDQTDVEFFIRASNNPFNWNNNYPEWKSVRANEKIKNIEGRYFQLACAIYPDAAGLKSPLVHSISLEYEKDNPPLPPAKVIAKPANGAVMLSWSPSVNFDVKGYLVYFGEQRGEYFAAGSPIDVGNTINFKIEGLKNGKIYFFAVAAYDEENGGHPGDLSQEVWARPLQSK